MVDSSAAKEMLDKIKKARDKVKAGTLEKRGRAMKELTETRGKTCRRVKGATK